MANTKISDETAATALTGSEIVLGVQSAANVKITVDQIADRVRSGLSWKLSVVAATTANGSLSSAFASGQTIDGVTLATGDRILVKNQSAAAENGIYTVPASGTPSRASDATDGAGFVNVSVFVSKGTTQADTQWVCTTDGPITLGSTSLVFVRAGTGGGAALTFLSDTSSTTDADGSSGAFRWNNSTQASATVLFFDNLTKDGVSTTTLFAALPPAGGLIMVSDTVDPTLWQVWQWSAITAGSGYYKFTAAPLASSGSIANAHTLQTLFIPLGGGGGGGGGLTNFAESTSTSSPNNTVNASQLLAVATSSDADFVVASKGAGALLRQTPDSSTTGGNKRGTYAVDLQSSRSAATQTASANYSTIVGGRRNTASGTYSVAGGDTNTASASNSVCIGGSSNTSSGTNSFVGGGQFNTASVQYASVPGGKTNVASGQYSYIGGGQDNTVACWWGAVIGGQENVADGYHSTLMGKRGKAWGISGVVVQSSEYVSSVGDSQRMSLTVQKLTTNATATVLASDSSAASATNQLTLQNSSAMTVTGQVIARQSTTLDTKSWTFTASIKRGANAAATSMVAPCTPTVVAADSGASAWSVTVTADTTLGCLKVEVTGEASKNIAWSASLDAIFVKY